MKDLETTITRCCSCCKRELPLDAFYFNKQQQCPDRYCKACRKTRSQESYRNGDWIIFLLTQTLYTTAWCGVS